jgi:hypothetical protein
MPATPSVRQELWKLLLWLRSIDLRAQAKYGLRRIGSTRHFLSLHLHHTRPILMWLSRAILRSAGIV